MDAVFPPEDHYSMFSPEGNAAVAKAVGELAAKMRAYEVKRTELPVAVVAMCEALAQSGFDEVYDTEPQHAIADALSKVCEELAWMPISRWDW